MLYEASIYDMHLLYVSGILLLKPQVHIVMNLNFSDTRTGNQLLLMLSVVWLIGYWANLMGFAWIFICLGLIIAIVYQIDRIVTKGSNWEHEANVPGALSLLVNAVFFVCLAFASVEFFLAIAGR